MFHVQQPTTSVNFHYRAKNPHFMIPHIPRGSRMWCALPAHGGSWVLNWVSTGPTPEMLAWWLGAGAGGVGGRAVWGTGSITHQRLRGAWTRAPREIT